MDMKTYIEGVLNLEIVERLYILKKFDPNSVIHLVTATGLDSSKDLIDGSGVLDKEFVSSNMSGFNALLWGLERNGFKVQTHIYEENYPGCPYDNTGWIVEKS